MQSISNSDVQKLSKVVLVYESNYCEVREYSQGALSVAQPLTRDVIKNILSIYDVKTSSFSFRTEIPDYIKKVNQSPNFELIWTCKAGVRKLYFTNKKLNGKYMMPNLCFRLTDKGLEVYAYKNWSMRSNLYYLNFPNLYKTGGICMGSAKINTSRCDYWEQITSVAERQFFESEFSYTITEEMIALKNKTEKEHSWLKHKIKKVNELF